MFWQVSNIPLEVKPLLTDSDILEMLRVLPSDHHIHIFLEGVERLNEHNQHWSEHNQPEIDEAEPVEPEISEPKINEPELGEPEINEPEPAEPKINEPELAELEINEPKIDEPEPTEVRIDSEYEAPQISSEESDFSGSDNDFENSEVELCDLNTEVEANEMRVVSDSKDGNFDSLYSADESDGDGSHRKPRHPEFNITIDIVNPKLKVRPIFANKTILRVEIRMYAIKNRYNVKFRRNNNRRIQVRCKAGCPWVLWVSPLTPIDPSDGTWKIKSLNDEHTCLKGFENANIIAKWVAKQYFQSFHVDPNYSVKSIKQDVCNDYGIMVSTSKCSRTKCIALEKLHGTTTVCQLDERVFKRVYICMQATNDGFKSGYRLIICLDGCHLKGFFGGHLLAVVGVDADDSIYPLAFVVVESENQSSWFWFLELLGNDLELNNSHILTFMTDRQKGLVEAVAELFLNVEHRTCVRHLYSNFKSNGHHKGKTLKDQLWMAARATYVREFEYAMEGIKLLSGTTHKWLSENNPKQWSKSHFSFKAKSDMLLNNLCECFNKLILEARDKPIITLLESIRTMLMQRIAKKKKDQANKFVGFVCPKIQKKLCNAISQANSCWPIHVGVPTYQVSCGPSNQHYVNIETRTCLCRKCELTGIPCIHAISVIVMNHENPENFLDQCYLVKTQMDIYSHFINPVRGPNQWTPIETMESILPHTLRRPPGRPHKNRRREADETPPYTRRVTKKGVKILCRKCGGSGHNVRTCKGQFRRSNEAVMQNQTSSSRSQKPAGVHTIRCMPTPTISLSQDSCVTQSSPHQQVPTLNQAAMQNQRTSPRPSQGYTVIWMPTPTVHIGNKRF
ncbi:uncharacterized protein LOC120168023 [Hibiscus syriacus]|uniref:uncharacterized protein LOC120168023 n=1 Tax=Hibiscus syriacus TaxID=106335 RepID=UPI001923E878|nr:uncharacterized protein LOC120168023 [Hibiscus syriacus]